MAKPLKLIATDTNLVFTTDDTKISVCGLDGTGWISADWEGSFDLVGGEIVGSGNISLLPETIAEWLMNDNSASKTVIETNGVYTGTNQGRDTSAMSVTGMNGNPNEALNFDNSTDTIDCGQGLPDIQTITVAMKVKIGDYFDQTLLSYKGVRLASDSRNSGIYINMFSNVIRLFKVIATGGTTFVKIDSSVVTSGNWYDLFFEISPTGMKIYIGNTLDVSNTDTTAIIYPTLSQKTIIGSGYNPATSSYISRCNSDIQKVRVYNKILTDDERLAIIAS